MKAPEPPLTLGSAGSLPAGPLHLAIGIFDGVHLGHQAVIEAAQHSAKRAGGRAGVLTFSPHPSRLFRPAQPVPMVMSEQTKVDFLRERLGIDFVIVEPFTREFAAIAADDFLPHLRRALPGLQAVYVGENWRYGAGRGGDVAHLVAAARRLGLNVVSAPRINHNGEPISSTRLRGLLTGGAIAAANELLGYAYFARGVVERGRQLGRTLGFPTLNLAWAPECAPAFGVYAVRVQAEGGAAGAARPAVANYGVRPTVESGAAPRLEVHVLGDCPWDAGARLRVEWLEYLRGEVRFASLAELSAQVARDREAARAWLAARA